METSGEIGSKETVAVPIGQSTRKKYCRWRSCWILCLNYRVKWVQMESQKRFRKPEFSFWKWLFEVFSLEMDKTIEEFPSWAHFLRLSISFLCRFLHKIGTKTNLLLEVNQNHTAHAFRKLALEHLQWKIFLTTFCMKTAKASCIIDNQTYNTVPELREEDIHCVKPAVSQRYNIWQTRTSKRGKDTAQSSKIREVLWLALKRCFLLPMLLIYSGVGTVHITGVSVILWGRQIYSLSSH